MKYRILSLILFFMQTTSFAQVGYRYHANFIELKPEGKSIGLLKDEMLLSDISEITARDYIKNKYGIHPLSISNVSGYGTLIETNYYSDLPAFTTDVYHDSFGNKILIMPCIILKTEKDNEVNKLLRKYSSVVSIIEHNGERYKLECNVKTSEELLKLIASIESMYSLKWIEPDMISYNTCNPYYSMQYYLKNTGQTGGTSGIDINVEPAWNITMGSSSVTVAVVDEGVDQYHEDFTGRVLSGYTIGYGSSFGSPMNAGSTPDKSKGHGVACAGVIAATDNSIGIRGISSISKILPVNIFPNTITTNNPSGAGSSSQIASAIRWAYPRADILSCSWGGGNSSDIEDAIHDAYTYGRDGKGAVIIAASGNSGASVMYPAALDEVISVGAIDKYGYRWSYSCYGIGLDVVAPSGMTGLAGDIYTTDRTGELGYCTSTTTGDLSNTNYTKRFGGTSAACPQVAGIAALLLSVDSSLTSTQVKNIITSSATKISGYTFNSSGWNNEVGYGLVNAYASVKEALVRRMSLFGSSALCDTNDYSITNLPAGASVSWNMAIDGDSTAAQLIVDTPAVNQCRINRCDLQEDSFTATLTATIIYQNDTLSVLSKAINAPAPFFPYIYILVDPESSGVEVGNAGIVSNQNVMNIRSNTLYNLISLYFKDKTPTISISPINGNYRFTRTNDNEFSVMVPQGGCLTATFSDGCTTTNWCIWGQSSAQYSMGISCGNGLLNIAITQNVSTDKENGDKELKKEHSKHQKEQEWMLEVYNASSSFRKVQTVDVKGNNHTLDTSTWQKGIYIVRAIVGKEILSEKITIK